MIINLQYFGAKPHTQAQESVAGDLLERVNAMIAEYCLATGLAAGPTCPNTGTEVSGSKGGTGDGGFRLPTSTTGSMFSSHKEARAVDVYDPANQFDAWIDTFEDDDNGTPRRRNSKLEQYGLYREDPTTTLRWVHLSTRPPGSGNRTFMP